MVCSAATVSQRNANLSIFRWWLDEASAQGLGKRAYSWVTVVVPKGREYFTTVTRHPSPSQDFRRRLLVNNTHWFPILGAWGLCTVWIIAFFSCVLRFRSWGIFSFFLLNHNKLSFPAARWRWNVKARAMAYLPELQSSGLKNIGGKSAFFRHNSSKTQPAKGKKRHLICSGRCGKKCFVDKSFPRNFYEKIVINAIF